MTAENVKFGKKLVIVGNGMTGFKFCQKLVEKSLNDQFDITVFGEEPYEAYDRVHLTSYYTGTPVEELVLAPRSWYSDNNIKLITGTMVSSIDRVRKLVILPNKSEIAYDTLVMATGSSPLSPAVRLHGRN